jgi:hypothetical protein
MAAVIALRALLLTQPFNVTPTVTLPMAGLAAQRVQPFLRHP